MNKNKVRRYRSITIDTGWNDSACTEDANKKLPDKHGWYQLEVSKKYKLNFDGTIEEVPE